MHLGLKLLKVRSCVLDCCEIHCLSSICRSCADVLAGAVTQIMLDARRKYHVNSVTNPDKY
ncbi:hypothetical protein FC18_GL000097 [Lacticaseibacillus sharpeae JCM 1186 = DSM 20505]|uniref:Uncharacterized protein n=1 Tax=Lacticaseibacillus sharpeae JCM 1186 = DSM 20505 TaxID=1291052 RepID=A0A0R1ZN53_9LACO|nr:hypothetical protein FC18_GL000097 [Lacticaseibacillus sharpeae JCM 1186 = DSM 20505]